MFGNVRSITSSLIACAGAVAGVVLATSAFAGTNSWTAIGPQGVHNVYGAPFAVDRTSPSTIYAVVDGTSLMKTVDDGSQWAVVSTAPAYFRALVIDPAVATTLYATGGTEQGLATRLYKSVDGGVQWTRVSNGPALSPIERLVIAPSRDATLYATQSGVAVWKSVDAGSSWTQFNNGLPAAENGFRYTYAYAIAVDPTNADTVYAAFALPSSASIFKLSPGADGWRQLPLAFPADAVVGAIAIDPVTPSVLYAAYGVYAANDTLIEAGVFKSFDAGDTWLRVSNPPSEVYGPRQVTALAIDPRAPSRIYATTTSGVYMSTDGALSWAPINLGLASPFDWGLDLDPTGSMLRTASYAGVFEYDARPATVQVQAAIEYGFRSVRDGGYSSYFVTSSPDEIAALDGRASSDPSGLGWNRTGERFNVWTGPDNGAVPTCRFFNAGLGVEHFYTPYAAECAIVNARAAGGWQYEGTAFYVRLPDEAGNCPTGTTVLYRLYSGREGAPEHRLTTSAATFDEMRLSGWIFEGDARTAAFACVPSAAAARSAHP